MRQGSSSKHDKYPEVCSCYRHGHACSAAQYSAAWSKPGGLTCDWWAAVNIHINASECSSLAQASKGQRTTRGSGYGNFYPLA